MHPYQLCASCAFPTHKAGTAYGEKHMSKGNTGRVIKFRAWNGMEMIYDVVVGRFGAFYVNPGDKGDGLDSNDTASLTPFNTLYSEQTPIMQFTGLHDKNGKEIYEDDLMDTGAKRGRVKFLYGCWHFVDGENGYLLYPKEEGYGNGGKWKHIEVIGNIYENPNLLK